MYETMTLDQIQAEADRLAQHHPLACTGCAYEDALAALADHQLTGRPLDIHERTLAAGFTLDERIDLLDGASRWRYSHPDGRYCHTDTDAHGILLDTTADLTGGVDISSF